MGRRAEEVEARRKPGVFLRLHVAPPAKFAGLAHVAFRIDDSIEELREAKVRLESAGLTVRGYDHAVSKSNYFDDPDGNCIEFYVDSSDAWKQDPSRTRSRCSFEEGGRPMPHASWQGVGEHGRRTTPALADSAFGCRRLHRVRHSPLTQAGPRRSR